MACQKKLWQCINCQEKKSCPEINSEFISMPIPEKLQQGIGISQIMLPKESAFLGLMALWGRQLHTP
jgi:hypothetical protein